MRKTSSYFRRWLRTSKSSDQPGIFDRKPGEAQWKQESERAKTHHLKKKGR
jgi:hypothetical protein